MIQRIQTVYLFIVIILSFVGLISNVGYYTVGQETVAEFSNFSFDTYGPCVSYVSSGPWCLGVLLIMVILLNLLSIMLFRKRMRQLRLTIISTMFLVGYIVCYWLFDYFYNENLNVILVGEVAEYHLQFPALMPVLSVVLNILAINGIRKDEALVRSLDRLR